MEKASQLHQGTACSRGDEHNGGLAKHITPPPLQVPCKHLNKNKNEQFQTDADGPVCLNPSDQELLFKGQGSLSNPVATISCTNHSHWGPCMPPPLLSNSQGPSGGQEGKKRSFLWPPIGSGAHGLRFDQDVNCSTMVTSPMGESPDIGTHSLSSTKDVTDHCLDVE